MVTSNASFPLPSLVSACHLCLIPLLACEAWLPLLIFSASGLTEI